MVERYQLLHWIAVLWHGFSIAFMLILLVRWGMSRNAIPFVLRSILGCITLAGLAGLTGIGYSFRSDPGIDWAIPIGMLLGVGFALIFARQVEHGLQSGNAK